MRQFRSSSTADAVWPRADRSVKRNALDHARDQGDVNEGTVRLLRDLAALGALTAVQREPAQARLEAIGPWLASLAYALVQEPRLVHLCHET